MRSSLKGSKSKTANLEEKVRSDAEKEYNELLGRWRAQKNTASGNK
jgi:hypothetical protein